MKISLKLRFLVSYIIMTAASLILINTYGGHLMYNKLESNIRIQLYNEAETISRNYLTSAYMVSSSILTLRKQFASIQKATDIRILIVKPDGNIIIDSDITQNIEGINLSNYDLNFLSNQTVSDTDLNGLLTLKSLAVIYPVTASLETQAYIVLAHPIILIKEEAIQYINTIVICYIILSAILLALMLGLYFQTIIPIKTMTKASKEYANGHFDYTISKISGNEMSELAGAIRYMAYKMSDMNDYQKKFIANVSHDFRSPLTSIKGYTEAMLDETIPLEMHSKYLDIILFETERLEKLTGNLLELSQFENNGIHMDISTFDINYEIRRCLATFEQRCTAKQISLELIFDKKKLFTDADQSKIEQVIQNLVDNAIKFSNQNSVIEIHTNEHNQKIFISIKDHGIGIPKDNIKKVWDRFYKSDLSRGKDKKGTGLGLSITKEIIEAHGENINVISTEGVGTEFIFTLPVHKN